MISKSDLKKPLKELTRLRGEQVSRYRADEERERLDVLGQESDKKALKWVQRSIKEEEKKGRDQKEIDFSVLNRLKNHLRFASEEAIPKKYTINIDLTDKGLVVKIAGTPYYGAFTPSYLVSYDRHYCKIMAVRLGNTVAKLEGYYQRSEKGIIFPDREDMQVYGA